jgi:hypothetical protein
VSVVDKRPTIPLDLVHNDLVGPLEVESILTHKENILTFMDDGTKRRWVYVMKHNNEVFDYFKLWWDKVELQSGRKGKILRKNGGGEDISKEMVG